MWDGRKVKLVSTNKIGVYMVCKFKAREVDRDIVKFGDYCIQKVYLRGNTTKWRQNRGVCKSCDSSGADEMEKNFGVICKKVYCIFFWPKKVYCM